MVGHDEGELAGAQQRSIFRHSNSVCVSSGFHQMGLDHKMWSS